MIIFSWQHPGAMGDPDCSHGNSQGAEGECPSCGRHESIVELTQGDEWPTVKAISQMESAIYSGDAECSLEGCEGKGVDIDSEIIIYSNAEGEQKINEETLIRVAASLDNEGE